MAKLDTIEKDIQAIISAGGSDKDVEDYLSGTNVVVEKSLAKPIKGQNKLIRNMALGAEVAPGTAPIMGLMKLLGGQNRFAPTMTPQSLQEGEATIRGAIKGGSLGYLDIPGRKNLPAELAASTIPYMAAGPIGAPLRAVKGATMGARLARIAGAAAPMATVGALRPAKDLAGRAKQAAFEGAIGGAFQAIPEIAGAVKPGAVKLLSKTTGLSEEQLMGAFNKPGKYLKRPLTNEQKLKVVQKVKNQVIKNVDDLTDFKYKTLEQSVADTIGSKKTIDAKVVKGAIQQYSDEMLNAGVIDDVPKPVQRLIANIDSKTVKGKIKFADAHKIKQDIYKIIKKAYGKENFKDVSSGAYKEAARSINAELRNVSGEYAKANDEIKALYDLADDFGRKGIEGFETTGGAKKFLRYFNDLEGRQLLAKVEKALPENKRFMTILENLEAREGTRKAFQMAATKEGLIPSLGGAGTAAGATYLATKNPWLAGAVGAGTTLTGSPLAIKGAIRGGMAVAKRVPKLSPALTAILAQKLRGQ